MHYLQNILVSSWQVTGEMAPYLLLGFLIAGVLSVFISPQWIERHLGGRGWGPIFKSTLFGVPLPLCSCGVIPVTASIYRHGASRGATSAFLLSTPQTGVDSILATYALLGPVYAVYRPIAALVTGILGGWLVNLGTRSMADRDDAAATEASAACSDACCATEQPGGKVTRAFRYGFMTLPRDLAKSLMIGILIAGLISAFVQQNALADYLGGGLLSMLVMLAVGIPIYVCSTASIPIAVGFIHMGASPGAALVFLIAGPATNAATISVMWGLLGRRTTFIYLAVVAVGSLLAGFSLDWVYRYFTEGGYRMTEHVHSPEGYWLLHVSAVALLAILLFSLLPERWLKRPSRRLQAPAMEPAEPGNGRHLSMEVSGMTCSHCVATVQRTLTETAGVQRAEVSLDPGRAEVYGNNFDPEQVARAVRELGYKVTPLDQ